MMMKIEIPTSFTRIPRRQALEFLQNARLMPDRFTAHRNGTYTARYLRARDLAFQNDECDMLLEKADNRVAILKRPSPQLDRGRYVTLQFSFAALTM